MTWKVYTLCYAYHNLTTICHYTTLLQYHGLYFLSCTIPITYSCITGSQLSPTFLQPFCPSHHSLLSGNHQFAVCIYRSVSAFCLFVYLFTHKSEIIHLSFSYFTMSTELFKLASDYLSPQKCACYGCKKHSLKSLLWDNQQLERAQWMQIKSGTHQVQQLWS